MAQVQSVTPVQRQDQNLKQFFTQEERDYQTEVQDASYEQRQMVVQEELRSIDLYDCENEGLPGDALEFDSEIDLTDDDAVIDDSARLDSSCRADGGWETVSAFLQTGDAIYIIEEDVGRNTFKCLIEEDLSKACFYRQIKMGNSVEPSRTRFYRLIAQWLEHHHGEVLGVPEKLISEVRGGKMTQKEFCEEFCDKDEKKRARFSRALKDAFLVWRDCAFPLKGLFVR